MKFMSIGARIGVLAIAVMLTGCNERPPSYQGWIEANPIFVGPDEELAASRALCARG